MRWTKRVAWRRRIRRIVETLVQCGDWADVSDTHARLVHTGMTAAAATQLIAAAYEDEMVRMMRETRAWSASSFTARLATLPATDLLRFE